MKSNNNILKSFLGLFLFIIALYSCNEDTIDFDETGAISGTVIATDDGRPLPNVEISTNPSSSTVFTDSLGNFSLSNIIVDSYAVQAELEGFVTGFESVTVVADQTSNVAFSLDINQGENLAPTVPILIAPEDGANDIDIQVELIWSSTDPEGDEITYNISLRNGTTNEMQDIEVVQDLSLIHI